MRVRSLVRRSFLFALFALGCALQPLAAAEATGARPNVLLLDLDTFRGDRLDPSDPNPLAPNLSALAHRGVYFPNCFSQAPRTLPSQMSILTSRYVSCHHVGGAQASVLADSVRTLAECFHENGYQTAAFVDGGWVGASYGFGQGFELFDDRAGHLKGMLPRVSDWLAKRSEKPFFIWIQAYDTHSPYDPPCVGDPEAAGPGTAATREHAARLDSREIDRIIREGPDSLGARRDSLVALMLDAYDRSVNCADGWVGEFVTMLERSTCRDSTIIVCISDHGEAFLEHGIFLHNTLHREIVHVPFFVSFPGDSAGLAVDEGVVQTIDVAPTLLDLAGIVVPAEFQGMSLAPRCSARGRSRGTPAPAASFAEGFSKEPEKLSWSIVTDRDHLIHWYTTGRSELYSWKEDPEEKRDRAAREPEAVQALLSQLMAWVRRFDIEAVGEPVQEIPDGLSEEKLEELRRLGYIH